MTEYMHDQGGLYHGWPMDSVTLNRLSLHHAFEPREQEEELRCAPSGWRVALLVRRGTGSPLEAAHALIGELWAAFEPCSSR